MLSKELEEIVEAALADGVLTDKERAVLHKRAQAEGVDPDELDIVLDGRLAKMKRSEDWLRPAPPQNLANQKLGNIVKCPNCGAQVIGGSAVCTECGYAFSNVSANSSAEKLQAKLDEFNRRQEQRADSRGVASSLMHGIGTTLAGGDLKTYKSKMDIISTFPVPNTRADLLEFLTMLQARANATGPRHGKGLGDTEDLSYAYWLLYTNCINKAKLSFPNDNDFQYYFQTYEKQLQKTKGIIGYVKCHPGAKVALGFLLFMILWIIGLSLLIGH